MPNNKQAPKLIHRGSKFLDPEHKRFYQIPQEAGDIIFNEIDYRAAAQVKIMIILMGTEGNGTFGVSEKWMQDRTGTSKDGYLKARKALEEKGWLTVEDGKIYVNFDAIYKSVEPGTTQHRIELSIENRVEPSTTQSSRVELGTTHRVEPGSLKGRTGLDPTSVPGSPIIDNIDNIIDKYIEPVYGMTYESYEDSKKGLGYSIDKEDNEYVYIHQFRPDKYFKFRKENK